MGWMQFAPKIAGATGWGGMFDPKNFGDNSEAFNKFADAMRGYADRYNGYVDTGNQARDINFDQYKQLINDPNFIQDKVASGFYESPYQKLMQDLVQKRMNYNSANTGMLGSGAANRALQNELTSMTGQFENDYINRGLGSYYRGLQGNDFLAELGLKGLDSQTGLLEQAAAGNLKGDMSANGAQANMWGTVIGGLTGAASMMGGGGGMGGMGGGFGGGMRQGGGMGFGGGGGGFGNPNASTFDINNAGWR